MSNLDRASAREARRRAVKYLKVNARAGDIVLDDSTAYRRYVRRAIEANCRRADLERQIAAMFDAASDDGTGTAPKEPTP